MGNIRRQPIKKRPLYRDEIRSAIKDAIMSGELQPGDRIVETRWARELGVSQSPVREAIRELEMIGLIENIPYQGSFVRKITKKDMKDSYRVRMQLELLGIEDAIIGITDKKVKNLFSLLKEMELAAEEHDFDLYVQKDVDFHQSIMEVSQNELLIRLWKQSNIQDATYFGTQFSDQTLEELSFRHESIYEAIKARDIKLGRVAVCRHFEELMKGLDKKEAL